MNELIKRQDAINAVMQNYNYESDRLTALQKLPVMTEEKIRTNAIKDYSVAALGAGAVERAKKELMNNTSKINIIFDPDGEYTSIAHALLKDDVYIVSTDDITEITVHTGKELR